jgi:UDP-N-acetylglucosamine 4,6-dehydratase
MRPGEKLHEEMITVSDSQNTVDLGPYYAILPTADNLLMEQYLSNNRAKRVADGFSYASGTNEHFLTVQEIRDLIKRHVDEDFTVL